MATYPIAAELPAEQASIEDPIRLDLFIRHVRGLAWDDAHRSESLQALFDGVTGLEKAEIVYYYRRRVGARLRSRICRTGAWMLGAVAVLVPVVKPWTPTAWPDFLAVGYVAIALAGALLLSDTSFAGTTAFQRYVRTQLELERLYELFIVEWQGLILAFDSAPADEAKAAALVLIARADKFLEAVHLALGTETKGWQSDMDAGLKDLRQQAAKHGGPR